MESIFKIYLYSFSPEEDYYTDRIKKSGCIFRNIKELSDIESVELARNDQLDIAIDLMNYTKNNKMNIFSNRIAPIQINYLGLEASTGSSEMDYLIADKTFFKEVYSLQPSSYLIINEDNIKKYKPCRYWFLENYFKVKTKELLLVDATVNSLLLLSKYIVLTSRK